MRKLFLIDDFVEDMILKGTWDFLNGKKTKIGMVVLFIYGGLTYLGYDMAWLKDIGLLIGSVGVIHGAYKSLNIHE